MKGKKAKLQLPTRIRVDQTDFDKCDDCGAILPEPTAERDWDGQMFRITTTCVKCGAYYTY